jgi:hypothetical protein
MINSIQKGNTMNYIKLLIVGLTFTSMSALYSKTIQICNDTYWFVSINGKIATYPYNLPKHSPEEASHKNVSKYPRCKAVVVPDNKFVTIEISGVDLENKVSYGVTTLKVNTSDVKKLHVYFAKQKDRQGQNLPGIEINPAK